MPSKTALVYLPPGQFASTDMRNAISSQGYTNVVDLSHCSDIKRQELIQQNAPNITVVFSDLSGAGCDAISLHQNIQTLLTNSGATENLPVYLFSDQPRPSWRELPANLKIATLSPDKTDKKRYDKALTTAMSWPPAPESGTPGQAGQPSTSAPSNARSR